MKLCVISLAGALALGVAPSANAAVYASGVVANQTSGLLSTPATAAVGAPTLITDPGQAFQSAVTPFSPPFLDSEVSQIDSGGQLTLQFPNMVNVGSGNEVGVFSNLFFEDLSYPNGQNKAAAGVFGSNTEGGGQAIVKVHADGINFFPVNGTTPAVFNIPTNAYTDIGGPYQTTAGTTLADFGKPMTHALSDFNGASFASMLSLFNGSGGGTWLNLAGAGLPQIDYIQFDVPANQLLDIDAVSINNADVGAAVPEPAAIGLLCGIAACLLRRR